MAGDQDGFPGGVAQFPDEIAHLCDTDGVKAIDRFVQDQKLRVVHDGQCDGQPLFHAERILREQLFIPIRQIDDLQRAFDILGAFQSAQIGKDAQVFCPGQIGVEPRRLNQRPNARQNLLLVAAKRLAKQADCTRGRVGQSQKHPHGRCFSGAVAAQQAINAPLAHMDGKVGHTGLRPILFGKAACFNHIIAHVRVPPCRDD